MLIHKHCLCVGVGNDRRFHLCRGHSQGDTQVVIDSRVDVNGYCAAHDQRIYRAPVNVPREDYLFARLADRHDHSLHCAGSAVYNKNRIFRAESVRCVFLRFLNDGNRVAEIVEGLHGVYVVLHADLAEKIPQHLVAAPALMAGDVKLDNAVKLILLHGLIERRAGVIKPHYAHLLIDVHAAEDLDHFPA